MKGQVSVHVAVRVAMTAALYALLTVLPPFNAIGYGPLQIRVAEALTVLPFVCPWAVWALYLGCILANLGSPFLVWDLTLGASATLISALLTRHGGRKELAPLPPVIVNALVISGYVAPLSNLPYWPVALYIALGQGIACYGLGYPFLLWVLRNERVKGILSGSPDD